MWHVHAVLTRLPIDELLIDDEASYRHIALYATLKAALRRDGAVFAVAPELGHDDVRLLNLAFWKPGDVAEILLEDRISADQLVHNGWHHVAARRLGRAAKSRAGLLLAEAIASASDVYLVGRLLGHAPGAELLTSQVPAMAEAAEAAGLDAGGFERLLERMSREPEACFEALRALLFDVTRALVDAADAERAAAILRTHRDHDFAPLLHHYELNGWVLFARAHGEGADDDALAVDAALRQAGDAMAWLEQRWLQ